MLLLPLLLGVGGCFFLFGGLLKYLFLQFPLLLLYSFLGLAAGGLPTILNQANEGGFRLSYLTAFGSGALFLILVISSAGFAPGLFLGRGLWQVFSYGLWLALGAVVPGLSASFLLMALGAYEQVLSAFLDLDFQFLAPLVLGFIPGAFLVSWGITYLFKKMHGYTYYAILGALAASLCLVFPGWPRNVPETIQAFSLFAGSLYLSLFLGKKMKTARRC